MSGITLTDGSRHSGCFFLLWCSKVLVGIKSFERVLVEWGGAPV